MHGKHQIARIRALNDLLREHGIGGRIAVTQGVSALDASALAALFEAVRAFDAFSPDNDPYGEHDCAVVTVGGERYIWKIDYYDRSLGGHSPKPCDEAATARVLTVMLASEY